VLGKFLLYVACAGQQEASLLGYSPLPPQLVNFVFQAINRINGHPATPDLSTAGGRAQCANPTFGGGGGGGGGNGSNGGGGGNGGSGGNGNGNTGSTNGGATRGGSNGATTTTAAAKRSAKAASGTNLGQGGSGVFGQQAASALTPAEQTATLLAARRQAAYGSLSHVHSETQTALEWAALYVPVLVYGPILLRRRRRSGRRGDASNKEHAGAL
jgi:hypothetical protein